MPRALMATSHPTHLHCCLQVQPIRLALPIHLYWPMWADQPYSFLLDSALTDSRLGRFSFVGGDPAAVLTIRRQPHHQLGTRARITILRCRRPDGRPIHPPIAHTVQADPFQTLRRMLQSWSSPTLRPTEPDHPPFRAGAVGYIGYEMLHFIEHVAPTAPDDLHLPDCCLMFVNSLLAHDHVTGRSFACALGRAPSEPLARARASQLLEQLLHRLRAFESAPPPEPPAPPGPRPLSVTAFFDRPAYARLVQQAKEHIAAGDVFELCLTHRLATPFQADPWPLYCHLRRINPAPFAAFLRLPDVTVLCASPERFLKLDPTGWAEARPIKGTRPRGQTPAEDARLRNELATSEKDRAENAMIVDLLRNDLGRVCRFGTVHVAEPMAIEPYATVFQMVSTVRGRLAEGRDAVDLLRACFPGGSMTGAPKVEAMKLINRLEPVARTIYSGAIGYIDVSGTMDLNIVIRTILLQHAQAYINVGGAVVADSDPLGEYDETMDKAQALLAALAGASRPGAIL